MLSRRDYNINFLVNSLDYAFFTLGLAFASVNTIFPLFARRLGAGNIEIGLIPALAYLGWSFPALWGGQISSRLERKIPFILKYTLFERMPFLGYTLIAFYLAANRPTLSLYLFFAMLGVSYFAMGFIGPIWMEMVGKVIHPGRTGLYFATGSGIGALMGLWGSRMAENFLDRYPFAENFGYCFLLSCLAIAVSYVFIALNREEAEPVVPLERGYFRSLPQIIRSDRDFTNYLTARVFLALGFMGGAFYTVYALERFAVPDFLVARYNAFLLVSQALSPFLWGLIGDRHGHKIVLVCGGLAILASNMIAIFTPEPAGMYLAFALFGVNYSALTVGGVAILLDFAPRNRRSGYLGLGSFVAWFPAFFAPLIGGKIADLFGYQMVFWITLLLNAIGFCWLLFGVREPKTFEEFG
ncbi:MAG TPA: MFS transporter [Atribacteraceae bacterium]|nr:MFS transporter [Atribacteraceae bacterium]